jgi:hypothetical protein
VATNATAPSSASNPPTIQTVRICSAASRRGPVAVSISSTTPLNNDGVYTGKPVPLFEANQPGNFASGAFAAMKPLRWAGVALSLLGWQLVCFCAFVSWESVEPFR